MKVLRCAVVRRCLEAFHDGELAVEDRIAVAGHLQDCPACAREARALTTVGEVLRGRAGDMVADSPDLHAMCESIVARLQAERQQSLPVRVGRMFEDMHLVWAGLSATAATLTCAALLFMIWFLSPPERDDSLAGVLSALAAPGSNRNPVTVDPRMRLPLLRTGTAFPAVLTNNASEQDLVFTLAAVVTQEGRIARSEVLASNHPDRDALILMNALNAMRFQPASLRGAPVAVNLVWLVTHTTVRAKVHS